jgi:formylglycine-generating enzyme required for sulfatase activity
VTQPAGDGGAPDARGDACDGGATACCPRGTWRVNDACVPMRSCPDARARGCAVVDLGVAPAFELGDPRDPVVANVQPVSRLSAFAIDAAEVTVARFRAFFRAPAPLVGAVRYPSGAALELTTFASQLRAPGTTAGDPECNYSDAPSPRDEHPMNCVPWATALAFCAWDGGRLPTEAEWEWIVRYRAAEGLPPGPRRYPWGDMAMIADCTLAQHGVASGSTTVGCPGADGARTRAVQSFAPMGGLYDLAGNVAEWTADAMDAFGRTGDATTRCWPGQPQADPLCTEPRVVEWGGAIRGVRGGSFLAATDWLSTTARFWNDATLPADASAAHRPSTIGFRCVRAR